MNFLLPLQHIIYTFANVSMPSFCYMDKLFNDKASIIRNVNNIVKPMVWENI